MRKKVFVLKANKEGVIGEYDFLLAVSAQNADEAKRLLAAVGHKYRVTVVKYGIFFQPYLGSATVCHFIELPLIEEEVAAVVS